MTSEHFVVRDSLIIPIRYFLKIITSAIFLNVTFMSARKRRTIERIQPTGCLEFFQLIVTIGLLLALRFFIRISFLCR